MKKNMCNASFFSKKCFNRAKKYWRQLKTKLFFEIVLVQKFQGRITNAVKHL